MQHFSASEFNLPDQMDPEFLLFLDAVRDRAGLSFNLKGDARTPQRNAEVGGVPTSLHLFDPANKGFQCRAVDFTTNELDKHIIPYAAFALIAEAVAQVWHEHKYPYGYELEFQYGDHNKHVHLGLFRVPGHPCHLVVMGDSAPKP